MFFWSHKNVHVVLNNQEEGKLLRELATNDIECVMYFTSRATRKKISKKISRYLKKSLHADPEAFNRRFVFRSFYDEEAQKMFPVMLVAYGRITQRATTGLWGGVELPFEEVIRDMYYLKTDEVYHITLFQKSRWPWASPLASGTISLPAHSIDILAGKVDDFYIKSDSVAIRFHRDSVRIAILDEQ